jgi:putative CocE/NonD family hydrolase
MTPYRQEYGAIDIPVLTTTGYFDGAQIGALHHLSEHYRYRPQAEHYLVIGPYDHFSGQRGTVVAGNNVRGYTVDPVARIDMGQLRYQWFDYVFKGAAKPALLQDRINYQVMGSNAWKHAPSLAAMGPQRTRLYFGAAREDGTWRLQPAASKRPSAVQTLDMTDRRDADRVVPGGDIVDKVLDTEGSVVFVSEPFADAVEFSGLFSGHLELITNKRDVDLHIGLYELTAQNEYFELSRYQSRLSYQGHLEQRRLLQPGQRQRFDFVAGRASSRAFKPGSRLVALVGPGKGPQDQINYGSGKDVSDETIADAGAPLRIEWSGKSYLEIPLAR